MLRIELCISIILFVEKEIKKDNTNFRRAISTEKCRDACKI